MARPHRVPDNPTIVVCVRLTEGEVEMLERLEARARCSSSTALRSALETVHELYDEEHVAGLFEQVARGE